MTARFRRNEHALHLGGVWREDAKPSARDGNAFGGRDECGPVDQELFERRRFEAAEAYAQLGEVGLNEPMRIRIVGPHPADDDARYVP